MTVGSSIPANIVVLSILPLGVELAKHAVHFQEVKADIFENLFNDLSGVRVWGDAVLFAQGLELGITI